MQILPRLLALSLLLILASVGCARQPPAAAVAPQPVASVKQLMEAMVIPSSDALFKVGQEEPKDDKAWAALRLQAVVLAESGNLLMLEGRARDREEWMNRSRALVEAGSVALEATEARNVTALLDAGDRIAETCEACHERYLR
jgi:hypothetical protein